jgi:IS605 OrfB family transposase
MKLTAKVKLLPTPKQAQLLKQTLEVANAACNYISEQAWEHKTFRQFPLHKLTYYDVREKFPLSAQIAVRCISKVADAYKIDRKTKRIFSPLGAIAFDNRVLSYNLTKSEVSIWTVGGRQKIAFVCGKRQRELLSGQRGESDLVHIDGQFYLFAACDVETPEEEDVTEFLGVDLGVKNIATDSDGNSYSGAKVNGIRNRYARLRSKLQAKGTKSAKRLLKKRSRKESRFAKDVNHRISKELVQRAKDTGRGIALENLKGIRKRVTVRKAQRRQHHSWSFYDLRQKIEYKAAIAGVPVVLIDPRNTSRTCPVCGCVDKRNRPSQSVFSCIQCGFSGHADTIAAGNIARRAAVNQPNAGRDEVKAGSPELRPSAPASHPL